MHAAVITQHGTAPTARDHPDPSPGEGEALIEVTAAPITPLDVLCATGTSYFGAQPLPYVPGVQGVGRVVEAASVSRNTPVWFPSTAGMQPGDGSMAEFAVAPEAALVPVPDHVEDTLVAALGLSAVAAWMALTWRAELREGEQVLVLGGGGVVGQVAVQLARRLGARRVVAACRSEAAQARAAARGADVVVPLRDGEEATALTERLAEAMDGPVDVVIDPLFGVPATAAAPLLGSAGRLVNLGSSAGESATFGSAHLRSHTASILGYTNNDISVEQRRDALLAVLREAETGLTVDHDVLPLSDVAAGWSAQAAGTAARRIVLRVASG